MSLKKHGVILDCEQCTCTSSDDHGGFDVTVPISDSDTDTAGPARLCCIVSPERHTVELKEWQDADYHPVQLSENLQKRVSALLTSIADKRVCGNRNICPPEVVRIVKGNSDP
jgi:hypothetical protein